MRFRLRALTRRLGGEGGFTMIELLVSMTILGTVMGGLTTLMVSGTNAQIDMSHRFEAQTEARLGLDWFRRDVHKSTCATTANPAATITLTSGVCGSGTTTTWCTVANGTGRYGLWRYSGAACSGTGRKVGDYLTTANAFIYTAASGSTAAGTGQLAFVADDCAFTGIKRLHYWVKMVDFSENASEFPLKTIIFTGR